MIQALVSYPLSQSFREKIEQEIGKVEEYLVLGELRRLGLPKMLRKLRAVKSDRLLLAVDDFNAQAIFPILFVIGSFTRAQSIMCVGPDGRQSFVPRWKAIPAFLRLVHASVSSGLASIRSASQLKQIARTKRIRADQVERRRISYLKTDLWFGVKAGGSVGHMAGVINGFARMGYAVQVFSPGTPELLDASVSSFPVKPPAALGLPFELNNYRYQRIFVKTVASFLADRRPFFLYHRMSVANYASVVLSRLLQVPLVAEYNGSEAWAAKHWGHPLRYHDLAVMAENVMLKHAHLIVTVSNVLRNELIDRGIDPGRIVMHPNCIDPAIFAPNRFRSDDLAALRSTLELEKDDTVVTFVGTFGKWHGAHVLARAIQHIVDGDAEWLARHRVRFLFVGDGLEMPRVREILASGRTGEFVRFAGLVPQAETPRYLAASDILVSPHVPNPDGSRFFGSPTKLFEYMAMAKGIVASDLEQIGQVLKNSLRVPDLPLVGEPTGREMAVLVRPDDEKELIAGIRFLVERPDWCRHLGANAHREVLARYTWDHHVNAILEGLRTVAGLKG